MKAEAGASSIEGVRLDGPEDKLIPLVDVILFPCRLARYRTRLLRVRESKGCVTLWWSRYAPAVFRGNRLLDLFAGGELIDHLTVQESIAA
jgi:hypothetical protein